MGGGACHRRRGGDGGREGIGDSQALAEGPRAAPGVRECPFDPSGRSENSGRGCGRFPRPVKSAAGDAAPRASRTRTLDGYHSRVDRRLDESCHGCRLQDVIAWLSVTRVRSPCQPGGDAGTAVVPWVGCAVSAANAHRVHSSVHTPKGQAIVSRERRDNGLGLGFVALSFRRCILVEGPQVSALPAGQHEQIRRGRPARRDPDSELDRTWERPIQT